MESLALCAIAFAIVIQGQRLMTNFSRLNAALASLSASIATVAERIRNPDVDNNNQFQVDDIATRLENAVATLDGLANGGTESHVDDGTGSPTDEDLGVAADGHDESSDVPTDETDAELTDEVTDESTNELPTAGEVFPADGAGSDSTGATTGTDEGDTPPAA